MAISVSVLFLFGLILIFSRRFEQVSFAEHFEEVAQEKEVGKRLGSGNWASPQKRLNNMRTRVRGQLLHVLVLNIKPILFSIGAGITVFVTTLGSHLALSMFENGELSLQEIAVRSDLLVFGLLDTLSFDAFVVMGVDSSFAEVDIARRLLNFGYLASVALLLGNAVITVLKNLIIFLVGLLFALNLLIAARPQTRVDNVERLWLAAPLRTLVFRSQQA